MIFKKSNRRLLYFILDSQKPKYKNHSGMKKKRDNGNVPPLNFGPILSGKKHKHSDNSVWPDHPNGRSDNLK